MLPSWAGPESLLTSPSLVCSNESSGEKPLTTLQAGVAGAHGGGFCAQRRVLPVCSLVHLRRVLRRSAQRGLPGPASPRSARPPQLGPGRGSAEHWRRVLCGLAPLPPGSLPARPGVALPPDPAVERPLSDPISFPPAPAGLPAAPAPSFRNTLGRSFHSSPRSLFLTGTWLPYDRHGNI